MVAHARPKLVDVPVVAQRNGHDCGPAAVRSVLAHFGRTPAGVDAKLRPDRVNGTPPDRLAWTLLAHGLGVGGQSGLTADRLRELTESGWPVVCPVQSGGDGHWVIVRGLSRDRVYLMDPAEGLTDEPVDGFLARWHYTAADGTRLDRFGLAVYLPK